MSASANSIIDGGTEPASLPGGPGIVIKDGPARIVQFAIALDYDGFVSGPLEGDVARDSNLSLLVFNASA